MKNYNQAVQLSRNKHFRNEQLVLIWKYGQFVLFQSEHEKQLMKQYRKEEKKMNKGRVEDPEDAQLKAMGFDPIQMRARRYVHVL